MESARCGVEGIRGILALVCADAQWPGAGAVLLPHAALMGQARRRLRSVHLYGTVQLDGRVVMLWMNTPRFHYANGGRAVLHGAVSEDDGRSWRGYREVAANPLALEPPPPTGDHGVTYTVPGLAPGGKLVTSLSTGPR